jgi:hypothetical protein
LQAVLLTNAVIALALVVERIAAGDARRASGFVWSCDLVVGAIMVLVGVERRLRWAHALGCLCVGSISVAGLAQHFHVIPSSHAAEHMLGLDTSSSPLDTLWGSLLMAALALWIALSPRVSRYFCQERAG